MFKNVQKLLTVILVSSLLIIGAACSQQYVSPPMRCPLPAKRPILTSIVQDKHDTTKEDGYWMNDLDLRALSVYGAYNEAVREELLKEDKKNK
jgi:hypothetical protein